MTSMQDKKKDQLTLASNYKVYGAFVLGLTTAIAFRVLIVLNHVQPTWVRPLWYFAVLGNFLFFFYRYQITRKRKAAVSRYHLIEKVRSGAPLSAEDRTVLDYLLNSIQRSPENLNYLIIFVFSLIAIAVDLGMTYFLRP